MRKARKETGLFVAEGASLILTARDNGFIPETLVVKKDAASGVTAELRDWVLGADKECLEVSEAILEKLASKDNPQSVLAVFKQRFTDPPPSKKIGQDTTWLALEEVRDPGNLGTIIRTVDAVGAAGIILIGNCCDPYQHECVRATMGSIFAVPLVRMTREDFLDWRADWPGDIVGTHLEGRDDFRHASYKKPVLLIMGREGPGLSDSLTRTATRLVQIPMAGKLDSLNLAVATALTLYQIRGEHLKLGSGQ